jgi:hypothetical protein
MPSARRLWQAAVHTAAVLAPLVVGAGCTDALGSGAARIALAILPDFGALAPFAANADQLHLVVTRVSNGAVVADTTVGIDAVTGEATVVLAVTLESSAEQFTVLLQAIRSSDTAVLFEGTQSVTVTAGSTTEAVDLPVTYTGPAGVSLSIQPRDTAVAPGASFPFSAVVYDANEAVVDAPVVFELATPADSLILRVLKYTGQATALTGPTGTVLVVARTPDGVADTARVSVGAVPAGIEVTPGFETVGTGVTVPLVATLLDAGGAVIGPATATWISRTPSVASVDGAGVVTAAAAGGAVIVGTSGAFSDSMLVRVAASGSVPVSAIAGDGQAFLAPRVGDTVVVDVRVNMFFSGGELLGSYNAQLTWAAAALRYVDVQPGTFGTPTINDTQVQQGSFRFSAANAQGAGGSVVVARVRFVAQAAGSAAPQLAITELSAAQTFTNLLSSVVVTNGSVTVRP